MSIDMVPFLKDDAIERKTTFLKKRKKKSWVRAYTVVCHAGGVMSCAVVLAKKQVCVTSPIATRLVSS
jgi:hypothetical protein